MTARREDPMDPAVSGTAGYIVTLERHGKRQMDRWRRLGGRHRDPDIDEIRAGLVERPRLAFRKGTTGKPRRGARMTTRRKEEPVSTDPITEPMTPAGYRFV